MRRFEVPGRPVLVTVAVATVLFVVLTAQVIVQGVVTEIDWAVFRFNFERRYPQWDPLMERLTDVGQRAVAIPPVLAVAVWLSRLQRSWRPVLLVVGSVVVLSGAVGVLKLAVGRAKGETGSGAAFSGGVIYPSGHSANTVLLYGLLGYLLVRYARVRRRRLVALLAAVPSLVATAAMTFVRSHWVSDIVAGWCVGVVVLVLVVELDRQLGRPLPRPRRALERVL